MRAWTSRVRPLLVVLDQFEEYFLYHPDEDGAGTFAVEFPRLVNEPNLRVNFLLSIREDAWAKLDRFEGRIPRCSRTTSASSTSNRAAGARRDRAAPSASGIAACRRARRRTGSRRRWSTR